MNALSSSRADLAPAHRRSSVRSFWQWLGAARGIYRSRQQLRALDAHQLRDIGVSKDDAISEAKRQIWDVPSHWIE